MPESVKDRCARCYEHIFLFSKSRRYHFDHLAIAEPIAEATAQRLKRGVGSNKYGTAIPGQQQRQTINQPRSHGAITDGDINPLRNKRDVWVINTVPFKGAHYAAYPPKLVKPVFSPDVPRAASSLIPLWAAEQPVWWQRE